MVFECLTFYHKIENQKLVVKLKADLKAWKTKLIQKDF